MFKYLKDRFLNFCEIYGSKLSNWAWHLRWNKRNRKLECRPVKAETEIWKEDGKKHIIKIIED
tara:strand:+ start:123 stop:311 length:189 start_codon:yes stop_codon:yes gene_type:complete